MEQQHVTLQKKTKINQIVLKSVQGDNPSSCKQPHPPGNDPVRGHGELSHVKLDSKTVSGIETLLGGRYRLTEMG